MFSLGVGVHCGAMGNVDDTADMVGMGAGCCL